MTQIGNYILQETIGEGTFGKVKAGVDVRTHKRVALKIIKKASIDPCMLPVIRRELHIMKMLDHRNIIHLLDTLNTDKSLYMVLELAEGGELFDRIDPGRGMRPDEARYYFKQLVDAVCYCHAKGVCHRDIKPENLLCDRNNNLLVTDFGLSTQFDISNNTNNLLQTPCGSLEYVAPEVLHPGGYDGGAADVWSCGCVLFTMLDGWTPWDQPTQNSWEFRQYSQGHLNVGSWAKFDPLLKDLLSHMLSINPSRRPTIHEVQNHPWVRSDDVHKCVPVYPCSVPVQDVGEENMPPNGAYNMMDTGKSHMNMDRGCNNGSLDCSAYTQDEPMDCHDYDYLNDQYASSQPVFDTYNDNSQDTYYSQTPDNAPFDGCMESLSQPQGRSYVQSTNGRGMMAPPTVMDDGNDQSLRDFQFDKLVQRMTRFHTAYSTAYIWKRIKEELVKNDVQFAHKRNTGGLNILIPGNGKQAIKCTIEILRARSSKGRGLRIVDFNKKKGDQLSFKRFYRNLYERLEDIVLS